MRTYFGLLVLVMVLVMGVVPMLAQTPAAKDLRLFYQQNCVRCHGVDGAGIDATGKKIRGQDLTDAAWAKATTDEAMVKAILNGKFFGRAMPAYKKELTPDEALRMTKEIIRTAVKGKAIEPPKS